MKTKRSLVLLLAVLLVAVPAFAQTTTTQTALSAAVGNTTDTVFSLVSATDFTASTNTAASYAYLGHELVQIRSVDTTNNTITVVRGRGGTASRHASGTVITEGIVGSINRATGETSGVFLTQDPIGSCTRGNQAYTLVINYMTHTYFTCNSTSSRWVQTNYDPGDGFASVHSIGDANYTATLFDRYLTTDSVTAARTITLPSVTNLYGKELTVANYTTGATFQTITIAGANGQLVNSTASVVINNGTGAGTSSAVTVVSTGGAWRVVSGRCSFGTGAGC